MFEKKKRMKNEEEEKKKKEEKNATLYTQKCRVKKIDIFLGE
jgi:hypothetical protein